MNKSIKLFTFLLLFISITSCDSNDEAIAQKSVDARYTYVKEAAPGAITFINTSELADSYLWDFGDGTNSTTKNPTKIFLETGEYVVTLTAKNTKTDETASFSSTISIFVFQGGLVTNGDFENGTTPWTIGVANAIPSSLLVSDNGNTYFSINVAAVGNPFDVNLSHIGINMTQGTTYRLTFDAWASVNRTMITGIGLSGNPFTNQTVSRDLTTSVQNYSIDLVANFSNTNSRIIFDMGAALGTVNIDNVTLNVVP